MAAGQGASLQTRAIVARAGVSPLTPLNAAAESDTGSGTARLFVARWPPPGLRTRLCGSCIRQRASPVGARGCDGLRRLNLRQPHSPEHDFTGVLLPAAACGSRPRHDRPHPAAFHALGLPQDTPP